ncbi:hypothetical protein SAMN05421690_103724 [Nitrosomonas sp. Nm51]|uniref:DUF4124 domain-containing protein n=1 Tax=Nitrosomonas sp. Nm51 TaxID=133720 RepID=UPI0008C3F1DD|nr:DUF4124 domain-containing protein [Nitrosomonas sp. Nm51]SER55418.1 hypothetical protein SAMN05421690_103724 [Nitrosomonas sp. Nm51]
MMKLSYFFLLAIILLSYSGQSISGVYKQVDEDGNVTYSNVQSRNAEEVDLPPLVVVPSVESKGVDNRIRQRRENKIIKKQRQEIMQHISEETEVLENLKAEYKDGNPDRLGSERNYQRYLDRVDRLKKEIGFREANLQALQRQLDELPQPE